MDGSGSLQELTLGQKAQLAGTHFIFFALRIALYSLAPAAGQSGSVTLFVLIFCTILTCRSDGLPKLTRCIKYRLDEYCCGGEPGPPWCIKGYLSSGRRVKKAAVQFR